MLEPLSDLIYDSEDVRDVLKQAVGRINLLQEYIRLEMTQTLPEDQYVRLRELRQELGIKL